MELNEQRLSRGLSETYSMLLLLAYRHCRTRLTGIKTLMIVGIAVLMSLLDPASPQRLLARRPGLPLPTVQEVEVRKLTPMIPK